MDRPFAFMSLALILGIIISYYFSISLYFIIILFIVSCALNLMKINRNITLFLTICGFGIFLGYFALNNSQLISKENEKMELRGIVHEVVKIEEEKSKYIIKTKHENIIVNLIGTKTFVAGEEVIFKGTIKIPAENTNPYLYDYRLNLLSNKIYITMTVNDYDINSMGNPVNLKYKIKNSFRNSVENILDKNLSSENSALMKGIILGDDSYLEEDNIDKYRKLGLTHILAVSGLHIGIIATFLKFVFINLAIKRKTNTILTLMIIWIYAFLIGFPPSMLRANIMITLLLYGKFTGEYYDNINTLFLAMFILLVINPMWLFNLGFQLSFGATLSMFALSERIYKFFYPYENKIIYALSTILSVQIGLFPIQLYYFNEISIFSIISNLIISPLLSFALILATIAIFFSYTIPFLAPVIFFILEIILDIQTYIGDFLYEIDFGYLTFYSPKLIHIFSYYLMIIILFRYIKISKLKVPIIKTTVYYCLFLCLFKLISYIYDDNLSIDFIDVSQGDGILINSSSGYYLMDTGGSIFDSYDIGKNITLPYLIKHGVNTLEAVIITHFDDDHSKALNALIGEINIKKVYVTYEPKENEIYKLIKYNHIPIKVLQAGDRLYLDKNTHLDILYPYDDMQALEPNNMSLVAMLNHYDHKVLFTGDIEKKVEDMLAEKIQGPVDILKVPHHGSSSSSSDKFLEIVNPTMAVISVGRNNMYGHPNDIVIDKYNQRNIETYRTDTMGRVSIELSKEKISTSIFIKEKPTIIEMFYINIENIVFYSIILLVSYYLINIYVQLYKELTLDELQ